ncbi:MAG: gamma-glutamyl-gamma-aminobutyrate hydrolase family protein [Armatimonadetes bacterium]|nr:gamma-glutamyl-gamma-aminobutyrate hydrolase family protein [Armatimonadota bacterium]
MRPLIVILCNIWRADAGEFSSRDTINRPYTEAVYAAGGLPVGLPCLDDETAVREMLGRADGLLITGGEDVSPDIFGQAPHPQLGSVAPWRDTLDRLAIGYALQRPELPVLGICRGIQSLAVFAGGTLIQDVPSQVPNAIQHSQKAPGYHGIHEVSIEPGSLLADIIGDTRAMTNSFHHQAVADIPPGFRAIAWSVDGVIEAMVRDGVRFCLGVQFHPELMVNHSPAMAAIFSRFVEAAAT